jgi:hypothetical protein
MHHGDDRSSLSYKLRLDRQDRRPRYPGDLPSLDIWSHFASMPRSADRWENITVVVEGRIERLMRRIVQEASVGCTRRSIPRMQRYLTTLIMASTRRLRCPDQSLPLSSFGFRHGRGQAFDAHASVGTRPRPNQCLP